MEAPFMSLLIELLTHKIAASFQKPTKTTKIGYQIQWKTLIILNIVNRYVSPL